MNDEELASVLAHLDVDAAAHLLVDLANLRGGPDNITVIVIKIVDPEGASANAHTEPIRMGATKPKSELHPAVVVTTAAALLVGTVLASLGHSIPAFIAFFAGFVTLLAVFIRRSREQGKAIVLGGGRVLGRAPYAEALTPKPDVVTQTLAEIASELRQSPAGQTFDIQWDEFDDRHREAVSAQKKGDWRQAIRRYSQAIRVLMQAVRDSLDRHNSDSAIEL